ncbi:ADC synthase [Jaminaea rosea]|uniref:aminodeoxychorismate synthase n=1 Tax=Jaminaea rosea TaxID=1569628 RepID=A0A316V190_9BASI|nr:ADC synthase [Jaminaea rosea]PWN30311.1 ADC synthase [Jaminaea rosea]
MNETTVGSSGHNPLTSTSSAVPLPRILIIDHFDSYTLNLLTLLAALCNDSSSVSDRVVVLPHTHHLLASQDAFCQHLLPHFDALILSPGPGSPDRKADFGFGLEYLRNAAKYRLPTLGVCLGHQGMATAFGGVVRRAKSIQHGTQSSLQYSKGDVPQAGIFANVPPGTRVTRYNSLTVDPSTLPECLEMTAYADDPRNDCVEAPPQVSELMRSRATSPTTTMESERCVLGLQHKTLPLWGVQFHPESIESREGVRMMHNFIEMARKWQKEGNETACGSSLKIPPSILAEGARYVAAARPSPTCGATLPKKLWKVVEVDFGDLPVAADKAEEVFARLFKKGARHPSVWLDSARPGDPQSNFSYMASPSCSIKYRAGSRTVELYGSRAQQRTSLRLDQGEDFWHCMHQAQQELQGLTHFDRSSGAPNVFRCGFVGYWGYEMGIDSLGLQEDETISSPGSEEVESLSASEFGFCPTVLQLDHSTGRWKGYILERQDGAQGSERRSRLLLSMKDLHGIGLSPADARKWADLVRTELTAISSTHARSILRAPPPLSTLISPLHPVDCPEDYQLKVEAARALIAQGESYELCLTSQFCGRLSNAGVDHFSVYRALRAKNPAPYAAFMELAPEDSSGDRRRTILSTSPERFLSKTSAGLVEMKPIKGTLPRAGLTALDKAHLSRLPTPEARNAWLQEQDALRRSLLQADKKERAENLMIVDLIRADLLSFCEAGSVHVPGLMRVESFESVHQLVTTVRGVVVGAGKGGMGEGVGPVEALRRCFPPGSMTGAPKRRSVTLLQRLEGKRRVSNAKETAALEAVQEECATPSINASSPAWRTSHRPRGVYSGALGWIGVDGATDFSVVIRTAVLDGDEVSVGAGGAITYLSDKEKEWQEVLDKVEALCMVDVRESSE